MRVISLASILLLVPSIHAAEARIPKTTVLTLALDQELEGKKVKKGKEFKAHLSEPVTGAGGQVIIPAGSELKGRIEDADERHLTLKFKEIETPSGKKSIEARLVGVDAENVKVEENELESPGKSGKKKSLLLGPRRRAWRRAALQAPQLRASDGFLRGRWRRPEIEERHAAEDRAKEGTEAQIEGGPSFLLASTPKRAGLLH